MTERHESSLTDATDQQRGFQIIQREILLLVVISVAAVPLYLFTRKMAEVNRHSNAGAAVDLYRRAQRQLAAGDAEAAIDSLRQAVTNDRNNSRFAFALAKALASAGRDEEAGLALLRLRENAPESPQINLELARLAARRRNIPEATAYYHHALYGLWAGEDVDERRREVRLELIRLLLDRKQRSRALAELLVMSADAPRTSSGRRQLAELFIEAGDPSRALQHFSAAAELDPNDFAALRGAGMTAFRIGDYQTARGFLARALAIQKDAQPVAELLETSRLIESRDPLAPRLAPSEQARRLTAGLDQVVTRLGECIARETATGAFRPSAMEKLQSDAREMRTAITPEALRSDPDLLRKGAELVFASEEMTNERCGAPRGFDHALLLIGRKHEATER